MAFAENLKQLRIQKNFTQPELAKLVGVAQPTFAQYESGIRVPNIIVGAKIASKLDTTVEKLVNGEEQTE
jgi:transcriptional regulator with XRE-family HTH domain